MTPTTLAATAGARPDADGPSGSGVVFIDKDGTLIEDLPYNVDPARVRFAPGARAAVRRLAGAGWDLVIVTNQSGVARGYFGEPDLAALGAFLGREIAALGGTLAGFYACPHLPDGTVPAFALECDCRKPAPGLIRRAARDLGVDPRSSWFIGDTWMDVAAGAAAGCRTILVGPEHRTRPGHPVAVRPDAAAPDLLGAAEVILGTVGGDVARHVPDVGRAEDALPHARSGTPS